jgi:hypothetical protein
MLIVHDDTGLVTQAIFVGDFERLKPIYEANGHLVLEADHVLDTISIYVKNGQVLPRPPVAVSGEIRPIAADGVDTLKLTIEPASFALTIRLDGTIVHQESSPVGTLEFAVDHPGAYELSFEAAFPYCATVLTVEAT